MIKLTVLYNLPKGADHESFLKWRTTEHQKENMDMEGLIKSDFYIIKKAWNMENSPYMYMTEAYFTNAESFEKSFYDPGYQEKLWGWLKDIADPLFLISEEVLTEVKKMH